MPTEYSLQELSRLADVTPRTIRYYIVGGLLPAPTQSGPLARYSEMHLDRLRLIKKLQAAHLPLAEIRSRLSGMADAEISTIAEEEAFPPSTNSAADYIRDVLGGTTSYRSIGRAAPSHPTMPSMASPRMAAAERHVPAKPPPSGRSRIAPNGSASRSIRTSSCTSAVHSPVNSTNASID